MKYQTFSSDNKYGLINEQHEIILPAIYDNIVFDFQEEYALIRKDNKWGMISNDGKLICDCIYDSIHLDFAGSDYACVANLSASGELLYGLIDKGGKEICECMYNHICSTPCGDGDLFVVGMLQYDEEKKTSKMQYGLINIYGELIQPCLFDSKERAIASTDYGIFSLSAKISKKRNKK